MKGSHCNALTRGERTAQARRRRALAHLERVRAGGAPRAARRLSGRIRPWPLVFGVALALGALVGSRSFAPGNLEVVAVSGADVLTPEEVARASGIDPGAALGDLDRAALTATLTHHAWIAEARALPFPGGRLLLAVVERRAVALLAGPERWAVDDAGVPFAPGGEIG